MRTKSESSGGQTLTDVAGAIPSFDHQFTLIYEELRRLASAILRSSGQNTFLNPTALVNEAYLKLASAERFATESPLHLKRTIAKVMRQVLLDSVRRKQSVKRGAGAERIALGDEVEQKSRSIEDLVIIGELIEKLRAMRPRHADIVECRFYLGLTDEETAAALSISKATVERDWTTARAWLNGQLE